MSQPQAYTIGLGTTRQPKVLACRRALEILEETLPAVRLLPRSVESGVEDTPRSTEAMMMGARHRAENVAAALRRESIEPDFTIGLEGGIKVECLADRRVVLLESWAYVTNGTHGHFGSSGAIELPARLAARVLDEREELGDAADEQFDKRDVASTEGTFGVLSHNRVTREDAFVRSLLHAFAPFYNASAYEVADHQGDP